MTTRSRATADHSLPPAELRRLKLSPEVAYYLLSRGIDLPECPPAIKTPEPGQLSQAARFDPARVDHVLKAFKRLRHTQGKWAGHELVPDPWQVAYILAPTFGWVRRNRDGHMVRFIKQLFVEVSRKNGKSTLAGGLGIYLTCADGEQGAQVLTAATTEKQAAYVFDPVRQLARSSPWLKPYVQPRAKRIVHEATNSYFEVVASVAEALHGGNIHAAVVDELWAHKTPDLIDAIETGTGSREQPLIVYITTADDGQQATIYSRKREFLERQAKRLIRHPSRYGVVWCADPDDDPFAVATQRKANPGFGTSPTQEYLEEKAKAAQEDPAELAEYLRLHLGIRTSLTARYIALDVWDRNAGLVDVGDLAGREAYGGLDLAATGDLNALCWDFPDGQGGHDVLWRFWLPQRALDKLNRVTAGMAEVWRREGFLTITEGDTADYDYIRAQVNADRETFDVRELAFDPWNSTQLVNDLMGDEAPMVKVRQGFASLSPPTKQLLHVLLDGTPERPRYRHAGNPVMRWMVDNLRVSTDAAGNVKPNKETSMDKIDGVSAAVMALDRAMQRPEPKVSAYETGGLEVL